MALAGYTNIGVNSIGLCGSTTENPVGLKITLPVDGIISGAAAYAAWDTQAKSLFFKIYSDSAGTRGSVLHTSSSQDISSSTLSLDIRTISGSPTLVAGTYWIEALAISEGPGTGGAGSVYDTGGESNSSYQINDLGTPVYSDKKISMFIIYKRVLEYPKGIYLKQGWQ